jgi:hypothetical protein
MNRRGFLKSLLAGAALAVGASTGLDKILTGSLGTCSTDGYEYISNFEITSFSMVTNPVNSDCKVRLITNEPQFTRNFGRPS